MLDPVLAPFPVGQNSIQQFEDLGPVVRHPDVAKPILYKWPAASVGSLMARKRCLRPAGGRVLDVPQQCVSTVLPFRRGITLPAVSMEKRAIVRKFRVTQTKIASECPTVRGIKKAVNGAGVQDGYPGRCFRPGRPARAYGSPWRWKTAGFPALSAAPSPALRQERSW